MWWNKQNGYNPNTARSKRKPLVEPQCNQPKTSFSPQPTDESNTVCMLAYTNYGR